MSASAKKGKERLPQPGDCPECSAPHYKVLPGYNTIKGTDAQGKPIFCQTCLKERLGFWDSLLSKS